MSSYAVTQYEDPSVFYPGKDDTAIELPYQCRKRDDGLDGLITCQTKKLAD